MSTRTEHDLRQDAEERERTYTRRVRDLRAELMQECPAGRFIDRAHLVTMLGQQPSTTRPYLAWLYLVRHGAGAVGLDGGALRRAVGADEATWARLLERDVWWTPPQARLDTLPAEYRGRVVGQR